MVKLNELPPEIVDIIVHIGSSPQVRPESRYEDLNSFARIAPVFQYASQRVMNEQVVLSNGGLVMVWLEERKEEFVVKELKLHLPVDHDRTIAEENLVVRAIRACSSLLRTFEVGGWHRFDAAILAEANLKHITSLCIHSDLETAQFSAQLFFPQLQRLTMSDISRGDGPDWHAGVLRAILVGVGPSFKALALRELEHSDRTLLEIDLVAQQLESLEISSPLDYLPFLSQLLEHLPAPSLLHLRFDLQIESAISISADSRQGIDSILSLPSLANLKTLKLDGDDGQYDSDDGGQDMKEKKEQETFAWIESWRAREVVVEIVM